MPIVVKVGYATSKYTKVACGPQGKPDSVVDFEVTSGAARVSIGIINGASIDNNSAVSQAPSPLITGSANITVGVGPLAVNVPIDLTSLTTAPPTTQTFGAGGLLAVGGNYDLNAGGGTATRTFHAPYETPYQRYPGGLGTYGATDSLVTSLNFGSASNGSLGSTLTSAQSQIVRDQFVKKALQPYMNTIDTKVLDPLIAALGATAGGADGKIVNVRCVVPALADRG